MHRPELAQGETIGSRHTPTVRTSVEVPGVKEGLTVGPDEVLIVVCHGSDRWELQAVRDRMRDCGLRPDQILLFGGNVSIGKAPQDAIRIILDGEVTP